MARFIVGQGPLLVLLHGVGLDHTMWQPLAERLASSRTVLAYDLRGHGEAEPLEDPASLSQFTEQLWNEVADLTTEPFSLCGFSMGAMIAQRAALEQPQKIANLILMSGVHRRTQAQRAGVRERLRQARQDGPASNIDAAIARWFTPEFCEQQPDVPERVRYRLRNNNPQEFLKAYAMFTEADADLAQTAQSIESRTLVTTGELDSGSTPDMMIALARELPNAKAHLLKGLAHMAPVEAPDAVAQVMLEFLGSGS